MQWNMIQGSTIYQKRISPNNWISKYISKANEFRKPLFLIIYDINIASDTRGILSKEDLSRSLT
jgi:hypothetical protein